MDAVGAVHAEWRDQCAGSMLALVIVDSLAVLLGATLLQVSFGAYLLTLSEVWGTALDLAVVFDADVWHALLFGDDIPEWFTQRQLIVQNIHLPRVLVGVLVGINLAVSGVIFQVVTRNELASPYILGISDDVGLIVLITLTPLSGLLPLMPMLVVIGDVIVFLLVYLIARESNTSSVRFVPAGVVVGAVFGSVQRAMSFFTNDLSVVMSAQAWLSGSLLGTGQTQVHIVLPFIIVTLELALTVTKGLDVLLFDGETVQSLGMPVEKARSAVAGITVLSTAAAIAVAGLIGLAGLIVPHMVRNLVGSNPERFLIGCAFLGPMLLVGADVGARFTLSSIQLSADIIAGLVGGLYFLYLMRKEEDVGSV